MSVTDELLANNLAFAASFDQADLPLAAARKVAVVACMDARIDPVALLGLRPGDAHVIRNVGGIVTDEEIRSLAFSQVMQGTQEIILVHHTDCGMLTVDDDGFKDRVRAATGATPPWSPGCFEDLDDDLRACLERLRESPYLPNKRSIRGFVFDVKTGRLREVR